MASSTARSEKVKGILLWVFLGLGVAAFAVALLATYLAPNNAEPWLIAALVVLVLALAGEVVLLVMGGGRRFEEEGEWYDWEEEAKKPKVTQIVLKCAKCARTFPVLDDGTRPLRAQCVHCGRTGMLQDLPPPRAPPAPNQSR